MRQYASGVWCNHARGVLADVGELLGRADECLCQVRSVSEVARVSDDDEFGAGPDAA